MGIWHEYWWSQIIRYWYSDNIQINSRRLSDMVDIPDNLHWARAANFRLRFRVYQSPIIHPDRIKKSIHIMPITMPKIGGSFCWLNAELISVGLVEEIVMEVDNDNIEGDEEEDDGDGDDCDWNDTVTVEGVVVGVIVIGYVVDIVVIKIFVVVVVLMLLLIEITSAKVDVRDTGHGYEIG